MIHLLRLAFHNREALLSHNPDRVTGKKLYIHNSQEKEHCKTLSADGFRKLKKKNEEERRGNDKMNKMIIKVSEGQYKKTPRVA